ncbi:Serine/threonine protein kinase [Actinacidiphila rubida]|uniref:Serine/threonine protein kinase n=1 Tax=Actinacidiphila rubida TaxID=310780 RepID=A0A1H8KZG7_9ACTN|nr:serine/threonine-protein kinase [Actinacidiphila rubida]SEN98293.1 Serine/threonine protein kinase [Actinacidiphila rubida]
MGASHSGPDVTRRPFRATTADDPAMVSGHRIGGRLGTSALGGVYLAHAPGGQPVALTVVHPELAAAEGFAARFHRDAQEAGRIRAPGVLPVLGSGQEGGRYWIATAYVPALPLDAAVDGQGPLPTRVVLRLVAGLAETLQALHNTGAVHGDLRPAHVLLAPDGPKVTGYGLAAVADPAADARQDRQGPAFLAPEQVAGRPPVPATDVFALGQVAAYASIGRPPFADPARVPQDEPDLNELPGELREIVTRCLIKEPGLRPSLAQVTAMCGQAAPAAPRPDTWLPPSLLAMIPPTPSPGGGPGAPGVPPVPPVVPPPAPGHGKPRRRVVRGAVGVLAVAAAVGVGVALVGGFSRSSDARGKGFGATATAPAASPSGVPTTAPASPAPSPAADPGDTYQGLRLPAGSAVVLRDDPPFVHPDVTGGSFGLTPRGDAFFAEPHEAWLSVPAPGLPSTLDSCRTAGGPQLTSVPRQSLAPGDGRMCVHMIDGTVALVTLRQVSAPAAPEQFAVIDVTVWRLLDQSAESDL